MNIRLKTLFFLLAVSLVIWLALGFTIANATGNDDDDE